MTDLKLHIKVCGYRTPQRYVLLRMVWAALTQLRASYPGLQAEVEEVRDVEQILRYTPVLVSASLVVEEQLVCTGYVPDKQHVLLWLQNSVLDKIGQN